MVNVEYATYKVVTATGFEEFYSSIETLLSDYNGYPFPFEVYEGNVLTGQWDKYISA